jgi:hypothetical protein
VFSAFVIATFPTKNATNAE